MKDRDTIMEFRDKSPLYKMFKPTGRFRIIRENGDAFLQIKRRLRGLINFMHAEKSKPQRRSLELHH